MRVERPLLYRALSCSGPLEPREHERRLYFGHLQSWKSPSPVGERVTTRTVALYRQTVAKLERLCMTHLEYLATQLTFREAEAVLIADPANLAF